ncbi:MAG: hypothetical protein AB6733_07220 [Clostridiaceae bacterium]
MKAKVISCCVFLGLFLISCGGQTQPTITPIQPTTTPIPASVTPEPTKTSVPPTVTPVPQSTNNLPNTVEVNGNKVTFKEWKFSIELPSDVWEFNPEIYNKTSGFEDFVFQRKENLVASTGKGYSPSVAVLFYSVPEGTELINFSTILRTQMEKNFPSIDSMFGYEGTEPKFKIPVLGYYGHLGEGNKYSVYIVHAVKGTVGVQVSFEIIDAVLDKAKPEFFEIMQSFEFSQ